MQIKKKIITRQQTSRIFLKDASYIIRLTARQRQTSVCQIKDNCLHFRTFISFFNQSRKLVKIFIQISMHVVLFTWDYEQVDLKETSEILS